MLFRYIRLGYTENCHLYKKHQNFADSKTVEKGAKTSPKNKFLTKKLKKSGIFSTVITVNLNFWFI
jgi:hypothetical protein